MLVRSDSLAAMAIVSIQTGSRLATIGNAIIDPRNLKVVALYCDGPSLDIHPAVLHTEDIREVSDIGAIIDNTDDIMPLDDLVRLKEVTDFNFDLLDKQVVDDTGRKVGKVRGYSMETSTFCIVKLHIAPGWLHALRTAEVVVDRKQIVEITPKTIVVKSPTIKEEAKPLVKPLPVVDNPFRQRSPQADTITTEEHS